MRKGLFAVKMIDLVTIGLVAVFAGFALVFASALLSTGGQEEGRPKTGGVIMIGPLPILFGNDAKWIAVAAILAVALSLIWLLYWVL